MPGYQYKAIGSDGRERKGCVIAASQEQAEKRIKTEGLLLVGMTEDRGLEKNNRHQRHKIAAADYRIFCRQFVTITRAGVSTINTLQMLGEQTENRVLRRNITALADEMGKGDTLSEAMRKHENVFSPMFAALVEAGEAEGNLESAFQGMAVCFEKEEKMEEVIRKTVTYPLAAVCMAAAVILVMFLLVIPNFMKMFADMDIALNAFTRGVLFVSNFVVVYWWAILLAAVVLCIVIGAYSCTTTGKYMFAAMQMKNPLFGKIRIRESSASFARMLAALLRADIPMAQALEVTASSMKSNIRMKQAVRDAKVQVESGMALSKPLQLCGLFPTLVIHMVSIGEETGELAKTLENVAEYYEEETANQAERLAAIMEPVLILIIALIVGILIMAVMQPMLALYEAVGTM